MTPRRSLLVASLLGSCVVLAACTATTTGTTGATTTTAATPGAATTTAATPGSLVTPGVTATTATAGPPDAAAATRAAAHLTAEVVQYRRDAQRDVLQVKVANAGPGPVHVTEVTLRTPTFARPSVATKDSTIAPGVAADLTVPLEEAACDGPVTGPPVTTPDAPGPPVTGPPVTAPDAPGPPVAGSHVVVLQVDGGPVELPVAGGTLEQVRDERCRVRAVAEHVDLAVADGWQGAGTVGGEPALRGALLVTPRPGADPVRVAVEGATTLFTVARPDAAELAAGAADPVALDVVLTVTRCDPHAVAEDKKGYLLPVRVSVGDAEPVLVEVAVPVPERGPLQELVDRTCRSGP